jgi:hypothetical protein
MHAEETKINTLLNQDITTVDDVEADSNSEHSGSGDDRHDHADFADKIAPSPVVGSNEHDPVSTPPPQNLSLFSRVRSVIPVIRIATRVSPASSVPPAAPAETKPSSSKGHRMKRAVKRIQIVKGLASHAILHRIREEHARTHSAVMHSLSTLLSSEATTAELGRISFDPERLQRELTRLRREQQQQQQREAAVPRGARAAAARGRRSSVDEYLMRREEEARRQREEHRKLLGFGMPQEEFMQSVELLGSPGQLNQAWRGWGAGGKVKGVGDALEKSREGQTRGRRGARG